MASSMKPFLCSYYQRFGFGASTSIVTLVVANTAEEARGMVLERYPNQGSDYLTVMGVDLETPAVVEISRDEH
jgi:hypothetical protein